MVKVELLDSSRQPVISLVTSHNEKHEEYKSKLGLDTHPDTQGQSSLCPGCSELFMDSNVCQRLAETNRGKPYRIEHYTISQLRDFAAQGCALCSILAHESREIDDGNMCSFFEIPATPSLGLRSEIVWATAPRNENGHSIDRLNLYYFAVAESPLSNMIPSRPVLNSVTDGRTKERIERAFAECLMQHEDCPSSNMNLLPSRVIDVEKMCLHETEGRETGTYVALSYCWGGDQEVKTTKENIASKKVSIELEKLPRTLQDAIQVCRHLAIRYLWIDALCIIQDNDDDKARELSRMALIYNRATLVVSASRAGSVYDGFLDDIKVYPAEAITLPARFSTTCEGEIGIIKVSSENSGLEPINKRGWTYQEISLASRALIYTNQGIIWQCNALWDRLVYDGIQMNSHPSEDMVVAYKEFRAGIFQAIEWDQAVRIYTLRSLTCPDDRLEALAGIATVAAEMWNSRYYAGLWKYDMARQLGWRVDKSPIFYDWKWRKPRGPSWCWASVDAPVCDVVQFVRSETPRGARVISCEVTLAHPENPFGQVLSGRLTVEAFMVEAQYAEPSWLDDTCMDSDGEPVNEEDIDGMWCLLLGYAPDNGMMDPLPQWDGLFLASLPDGIFQRVGVFRQDLDRWNSNYGEEGFDEYYAELEGEKAIGPEAEFPMEGSRRTVVIV